MSGTLAAAAWVAIGAPFAGAALTPLAARVHDRAGDAVAIAASFVAAAAALRLAPALLAPEALPVESTVPWLTVPVTIDAGVLVDPLGIVLANVVAVVSFAIMVYCRGYLQDDASRTRFWMWMNAFIGSMLLLVLASNLLLLFVGWKLVGVCSYGLIGYYYRDQRRYWIGGPPPTAYVTPSEAALKALLVTGAGDLLMLGGFFLLYGHAGTLGFVELYETAPVWLAAMAETPGMVLLVSLLLLAGPLGKSAQFPFHEWLPEAMTGPGPVSALIHAATMVKSGVYLVARLVPLFHYGWWVAGIDEAAWFFHLAAWLGAATALLAATQALVAVELKKVLAYSTVSQIGYMMLALGAAGLVPGLLADGYTAAVFHLISHALFKACLFLAAGTVIHAVHSIYITDMGGVRRALPLTWICTLAAGWSLMGLPPSPGFWSKDAVLLAAAEASAPLFVVGLVTAGLTAFYTVRLVGLVFHGPAGDGAAEHAGVPEHAAGGGRGAPDGTFSMRAATAVLGVGIVAAGLGGTRLEGVLHHGLEAGLPASLSATPAVAAAEAAGVPSSGAGAGHGLVLVLALLGSAAGALPAWRLYVSRRASPEALLAGSAALRALDGFFRRRWEIDALYRRVFVDGTRRLAALVASSLEAPWDRAVHRGLPWLAMERTAQLVHWLQADSEDLTRNVAYVLAIFAALLAVLLLAAGTGG
ncbi:MAG: NADH-quinone oxidoreductase subunit L [Acidobacteria bacterium]|nr:NADH-quinone oxidoreductase subunit L [Acidobacteriota bacterium]